ESPRAMPEEPAGPRLVLATVADTDLTRPREGLDLKTLPLTADAAGVLADPSIQIVIELVGGLEPARTFILKALQAGKHVVTANKALLAHHGAELYDEARRRGVTLAFEAAVAGLKDIHAEGITRVTQQDVGYARELGYRIKLLAIAKASGGEGQGAGRAAVEVRVHPTMIPASSPLATVSGVFNAIFITGDAVGDLMFYGRGAGQLPTASAVWADTLDIARRIAHDIPALALELPSAGPTALPRKPMDEIRCCYYLRVMAQDRPGVLSKVAGILGDNNISIANVIQKGRGKREAVPVVMLSHEARELDMRNTLAAIDKLPDVAAATTMFRLEGGP